ncbi:zinc ABC transporter substrate-binding protein [Sneathiella limimaris]|uniref:zinc ABC transporter substrate-binding protein n=1 Tax=Sneathiella limimaris TaxID=1964213 RepID=UPI00146C9A7B|nr:zinc ABC transporter substrate-binding protein [Sneathiella limimaris]
MRKLALIALVSLFFASRPATASDVVVSIPPLHALVQAVMGDTAEAELLLTGNRTPHDFQFKPSQIRALQDAKIVFYISPELEISMMKAFNILPASVKQVEMISISGLKLLPFRGGDNWAPHVHAEDNHKDHDAHDDHDKRDHAEHKHDEHEHKDHDHEKDHAKHDEHDHDKEHEAHAEKEHEHHHGDGHDHDPHLWLSPVNAKLMVHEIAHELAELFPEHAALYEANAEKLESELDGLKEELDAVLAPVKEVPFLVLHDGYQYFETETGLTAVGSILVNPSVPPSVKRMQEIQERVKETGTVCIFREPQFPDRIARTVAEGSGVKLGTLDPLGGSLDGSKNRYVEMMRKLAADLKACLS